ncbi:MAG TPA: Rieske 2Fe-2S domain-containing protein [Thermomicrobiales bacterium]|nr:Rieske 2Fe-2S domain-containing protein [Thermomicrobiales bacterium]
MAVDNTQRVVVGPVEALPPGTRKIIVPFRGRAGIGVFNVNGTFHALRNLCPHKSGPLCTGRVSGRVVADAPPTVDGANLDLVRVGEIIRCPWHLWEFEIATGRCLVDPRVRVKTYPVVVEDGRVVVYADPADLPAQIAPPGPALQVPGSATEVG